MKKIYLVSIIILALFSCVKGGNNPEQKAGRIKFDKWHEAIIPKNSVLIADNKISNIRKGLFRTGIDIEVLKKAYALNGYREEPDIKNKKFYYIKDNVKIQFIVIDEKNINLMIDINNNK